MPGKVAASHPPRDPAGRALRQAMARWIVEQLVRALNRRVGHAGLFQLFLQLLAGEVDRHLAHQGQPHKVVLSQQVFLCNRFPLGLGVGNVPAHIRQNSTGLAPKNTSKKSIFPRSISVLILIKLLTWMASPTGFLVWGCALGVLLGLSAAELKGLESRGVI